MIFEDDQRTAHAERAARTLLLAAGAEDLPRAPWLHTAQPPPSGDLVRFVVWRGGDQGALTGDQVAAGLALLPAAREELDQVEAAMLFTARAEGLSWARIARAMGLGSAQAAVQRYERLTERVERNRR